MLNLALALLKFSRNLSNQIGTKSQLCQLTWVVPSPQFKPGFNKTQRAQNLLSFSLMTSHPCSGIRIQDLMFKATLVVTCKTTFTLHGLILPTYSALRSVLYFSYNQQPFIPRVFQFLDDQQQPRIISQGFIHYSIFLEKLGIFFEFIHIEYPAFWGFFLFISKCNYHEIENMN